VTVCVRKAATFTVRSRERIGEVRTYRLKGTSRWQVSEVGQLEQVFGVPIVDSLKWKESVSGVCRLLHSVKRTESLRTRSAPIIIETVQFSPAPF
jgi:hypothetical protein